MVVDAPRPEPSAERVRVHVASAGICGSDLHLLAFDLPVVMGHELAGTLDDGTPVAVEGPGRASTKPGFDGVGEPSGARIGLRAGRRARRRGVSACD